VDAGENVDRDILLPTVMEMATLAGDTYVKLMVKVLEGLAKTRPFSRLFTLLLE
jgi:hypothetical protein